VSSQWCCDVCGRIYLAADDVEGWLGPGVASRRGEIEEATRLASNVEKTYTLAININTLLDGWDILPAVKHFRVFV
jgi:hypothetical protein